MTLFIRKAILLSFTCLGMVSLAPQVSYGADANDIPTNQPTPAPKKSTWQKLFGDCLGCIKDSEVVINDIQPVIPAVENDGKIVINDGKVVINDIEQVIGQKTQDTNTGQATKSTASNSLGEQDKVKNMTGKAKAATAGDNPDPNADDNNSGKGSKKHKDKKGKKDKKDKKKDDDKASSGCLSGVFSSLFSKSK